jgi:hypothetical protein
MDLVPARDPDAARWEVPDEQLGNVCQTVLSTIQTEERFLSKLPAGRVFRVNYELLVREPAKVLEPLFVEFLELADANHAIAAMKQTSEKDVQGKVDFASRSIARWQRDLDEAQCEIVNKVLAPIL